MDFSQLLVEKIDTIAKNWVEAVRQDKQIKSADDLPAMAVQDHIPHVLAAMATVLSQSQSSDVSSLVRQSLEHGVLRAEQGFAPAEIVREYHLLRREIFSALEAELKSGETVEVLRIIRLIDTVVDEAIGQCFTSYTNSRLYELEQLQSQLQLNNQELKRLLRANQDNLSYLAHELKNPLTSIIGYSDLFLRQQRQNTVQPSNANLEHIERVLRSSRHLLRLINDALEISRYEAGKMKLQLVPTDVQNLIKQISEMLEPMARAKELRIVIDCARAPNQVLIDPLRLQQIVTNLLSNAIRYTESGTVKLTCQILSEHQWSIVVQDTGIGITPEDQQRVFEPFFQVGLSRTSLPESTGLGLAIVAQLVNLMQGKIQLVSQVGVGSTFTVILPLEVVKEV